jgi:hypothetical protein
MSTFTASEIRKLRAAITACINLASIEELPDGWSRSPIDLDSVMRAVPSLRLQPGWSLRGYVFREGMNGNGVVWAVPQSDGFPEPHDLQKLEEYFLAPPSR